MPYDRKPNKVATLPNVTAPVTNVLSYTKIYNIARSLAIQASI